MSSLAKEGIRVVHRTRRDAISFTMEWTIQEFHMCERIGQLMSSPGTTSRELGVDTFEGIWRISCHPRNSQNSVDFVYVYLSLSGVNDQSLLAQVMAKCTIRMMTGSAMDVQVREPLFSPEFFLTTNTYQFGSSQFVSNAYLLGKGNQAGVIKDDMITIIMDVTIYKQPTTVTVVPPVLPMRALSSKEFLNRQVALSCSGRDNHSDFVLRSSDGKLFPVHGFLLMAHSPVFEAMLSHDSREKQQSQCDLADVDSESVEILVNYLYGCQAERVNINNAEKVLIMADKYQILDLRAVCEALLSETLDVDSMMERYILASHRGLDVLKNAALRVIGRNMQTVLKDDGMRAAMQSDPGLLSVIVEYYEKYCR